MQGLKGDPTYLIVEGGRHRRHRAQRHLHPSGLRGPLEQRRKQVHLPLPRQPVRPGGGRGPRSAPLPLALAHVVVQGERVQLSTWSETDPRTGEQPWWS